MAGVTVQELEAFLTQRCPRRPSAGIKRAATGGGVAGMIAFGVFFIIFSLPFMFIFFPWQLHQEVLMKRGSPATASGVVTSAPDSNMRVNDTPVYTVRFVFTVNDVEREGVSYSTGRRYSSGQTVQIEYLEGNPDIARISGTSITQTGMFGLFVLIFPLAGIGVAYGGLYSYRSKMRILRNGAFAAGQIKDVAATNVRVNNQTVYRIEIDFQIGNGSHRQSAYKTYRAAEIALAQKKQSAGQTVGVLYLPENPGKVLFVDGLVKNK